MSVAELRLEVERARAEAAEATSGLGHVSRELGELGDKVDACINDVRAIGKVQRETFDEVLRLSRAFRRQFGSLSEEVTELRVAQERGTTSGRWFRWGKKLAVPMLKGALAVVGAGLALTALKHCGVSPPNTVEVSP